MNAFEGGRRLTHVFGVPALGLALFFGANKQENDAKVALSLAAFVYAFSWVFGWIVRGFMGIPAGKDEKPKG